MPNPLKKLLLREVLWLLGSALAAWPVSRGLHQLVGAGPFLSEGLQVLAQGPGNLGWLLHGVAMAGIYFARLGFAKAGSVATLAPID